MITFLRTNFPQKYPAESGCRIFAFARKTKLLPSAFVDHATLACYPNAHSFLSSLKWNVGIQASAWVGNPKNSEFAEPNIQIAMYIVYHVGILKTR